jgi:hypothetical protein
VPPRLGGGAARAAGETHKRRRSLWPAGRWLLIAVGVILAVLSLFADVLRLGAAPGFGWKQIVGLVVGLALIGYGFFWGS